MYLVENLNQKMMNEHMCWTITSYGYVIDSVQKIKDSVKGKRWKLPATEKTPTTKSFVPWLDGTEELGHDGIKFFQEMIVMLIWETELLITDILHEVLLLSHYRDSPREGNMEEILHIYAFLYEKQRLTLYMNLEIPH